MEEEELVTQQLVEEAKEITHEMLRETLLEQIIPDIQEVQKNIVQFLKAYDKYNYLISGKKLAGMDPGSQIAMLESVKRDLIYSEFFNVQNSINEFIGQKIQITYVYIGENGQRELRLSPNDIGHIQATRSQYRNFIKLSYVLDNHYQVLKNSLKDSENEILQNTAAEITRRYNTYNKLVLWHLGDWKGYKVNNLGAINEAFANLYIHEIKLNGSMEWDIDTFMEDDMYGAIRADNANGFLIGDVSRDGIQYAVKGQFGSPQNFERVAKDLKELFDKEYQNFSIEKFYGFIDKYTREEADKASPLLGKGRVNPDLEALLKEFNRRFKNTKIYKDIVIEGNLFQ